jgi:hypothetical protein
MLLAVVLSAPAFLFFDPVAFVHVAHIPRDPTSIWRLYGDDFAYISASRSLARTATNLFVPHNTHIVPAWRMLTWALVALAGSLERIPLVLAEASYGILVAVMLLIGRLVARETGRSALGMAAMVTLGTTSVVASPTCWYSAGQTLWAGFFVLAALWYAQCYRRSSSILALPLAAGSAMLAGWFWTIGHVAGPISAMYLCLDGRRRCLWAAAAPLAGTALAVALSVILGAGKLDTTGSLHGRTTREAVRPVEGLLHTVQAIPENLLLGNLGLKAHTTESQGMILTVMVLWIWGVHRWRSGRLRAFNPLECTGLALLFTSYLIEWTVRGYMPFRYLRTINLGMIVPWYDTVPQIGAILFAMGWWAGPRSADGPGRVRLARQVERPSRRAALGVLGLLAVMFALNRPRVDLLWRNWMPPLSPREREMFPLNSMQMLRTNALLLERAAWQRRHLRRLDQAQQVAARLGIGRDAIRQVFGRLDMPELPGTQDAAGLLNLPERGSLNDPAQVRRALAPYVFQEPEPRPGWIQPDETWPPTEVPHQVEPDVDGS